MEEGGYTDRQLPRLWASKTDIEAFQEAFVSFLSGEKWKYIFIFVFQVCWMIRPRRTGEWFQSLDIAFIFFLLHFTNVIR